MKFLKTITLILFVSLSYSAFSQTDTLIVIQNVLTADELVVSESKKEMEFISASRSSKKISELPITIYVITRQEILENGYITLVDVLKSIPGIRVSQPGSGTLGEMFLMRGMVGNSYAKILINNVQVRPSVVAGMPIEAQLPVRQAERIEVIFGPASALYGADATVGVINIITKEADNGIFSEADISLGDDGYSYVNFHAGGKAGRNKNILKYSFYGSKMNLENLDIFQDTALYHPLQYLEQSGFMFDMGGTSVKPTSLTTALLEQYGIPFEAMPFEPGYEGTVEMPDISRVPAESQLIGLDLSFRRFSVSYQNMSRQTHSSIGRTPYLYKYNNPGNFVGDKMNRITIGYKKKSKRVEKSTNFSFINYAFEPSSSYGVAFINTTLSDTYYQYSASYDAFLEQLVNFNIKEIELTAGASLQLSTNLPVTNYAETPFDERRYNNPFIEIEPKDSLEAVGLNQFMFVNTGIFLQAYYSIGKFRIMGGLLSDFNGLYNESSFNPRAAILYNVTENMSMRLAAGRAFRAPTGNQMYENLAFANSQGGIHYAIVPNKNLKPEYFRSYEFGIRNFFLNGNIYTDISTYYNYTANIITNGYVNPAELGLYQANNFEMEPYARTPINSDAVQSKLFGIDANIEIRNIWKDKIRLNMSASITNGNEIKTQGNELLTIETLPPFIEKLSLSVKPRKRLYVILNATMASDWKSGYMEQSGNTMVSELTPIDGYLVFDSVIGFHFHNNLNLYLKIINLTNQYYGGIASTGYDVDLPYNPQLGRSLRFGMTFNLN